MTLQKRRDRVAHLEFRERTVANGIRLFPDGMVELLDSDQRLTPARARVEITYDRPSKTPKVVTRVPVVGPRLPTHPHDALIGADRLLWVDTSSRQVGEQWVHACAVILGVPYHAHFRTYVRCGVLYGLEFRGSIEKPERFAWREVIERARRNPNLLLNWKVCVVVDSDLGLLTEINAGTHPVYQDYLLPNRFRLAYASADTGQEMPLNVVLRRCDRLAAALLDRIQGEDPAGAGLTGQSLFGPVVLRFWDWNNT